MRVGPVFVAAVLVGGASAVATFVACEILVARRGSSVTVELLAWHPRSG